MHYFRSRAAALYGTTLLATVIFLGVTAPPAVAQTPQGPAPMPQIFVSPFGEVFTAPTGEAYPVEAWFKAADTDGDGALTYAEFEADGARFFAHLDKDADGQLSYAELNAYETERTAQVSTLRGPRPEGGPAGREGGPPPGGGRGPAGGPPSGGRGAPMGGGNIIAMAGLLGVREPVKSADTNTSQSVTAQEWAAVTQRWMSLLDTDKDGKLTLTELPKTALQQAGATRGRNRR